jgi:HlyD family secretion protein
MQWASTAGRTRVSVTIQILMRSKTVLVSIVLVIAVIAVAFALRRRGGASVVVDAGVVTRRATFRSTVTASGEVVATRYADVGSDTMGRIVKLPVAEGDRVKTGQILARIDAVQAQSEASSSAEQVQALEAEERAAGEAVHAAAAEVAAAASRAREAEQQFARRQDLNVRGLIPTSEFDTARAALETATAQVASARATADQASQVLASASRRVAQGRAQRMRADDVLKKTSVVSPIDGVVTRLGVREGEMVVVGIQNQPGTTLMTISDLTSVNAEVKVAEADVLRIAIGQPASVTLEALPGKRFTGRVLEVGASALPLSGASAAAREFRVVVRLDAPDPGLRPGMTCDAEIITKEKQNALTVPLQAVVLRSPSSGAQAQPGVFVISANTVTFTPVTQGAIGGIDIEIEGVQEGVAVVVGPFQVLRELQSGAVVRVSQTPSR